MFPKIISAIDIGTNSFHLLVAKINRDGFEILHREREVVRLRSKSESEQHVIVPEKIQEAIFVLTNFKTISDSFGATIIAVATSALRDAVNGEEVIHRVNESTGIIIKIISGDEEANLVYEAAVYKNESRAKDALIFDLGGGSTEFVLAKNGKVVFQKSIQLGAVRFSQKFFPNYLLNDTRIQECRNAVKSILLPVIDSLNSSNSQIAIGIGGTITSICWLIEKNINGREHNFNILPNFIINLESFYSISNLVLNKKSLEERIAIPGLERKRADIIPAGIIVIDELMQVLKINEIIAPGVSLKEGIIINALKQMC